MKSMRLLAGLLVVGMVWTVQAETYVPDAAHTFVSFSVRHLGISKVSGQFGEYEGTVTYDGESVESLAIQAVIQVSSVNTHVAMRDEDLRSVDYFDAATYPTMTFTSKRVETRGSGAVLVGDMTIKGVTKEVELAVTVGGPITDPWGNQRLGVLLSGTLDRHDFGVGHDKPSDKTIGSTIQLDVAIEAVKP